MPEGHWDGLVTVPPLSGVVVLPSGNVVPPSGGGTVMKQSAGGVGLPMHTSQRSHGFQQPCTGVQVRHFVGSVMCAKSHVPSPRVPLGLYEPSQTYLPASSGKVQQPKQSQPLGVSGRQKPRHWAD